MTYDLYSMTFYNTWIWLVDPVWNNAVSYTERMALGSQGKLYIPALREWTLKDLSLWENIVFEEVDHANTLTSCTWLSSLLKLQALWKTIYITDNHNHALYFWYDALSHGLISPGATLLHVDQHADMNEPISYYNSESKLWPLTYDLQSVATYVNTQTQIASFIQPALHAGLVKESVQIRSESKLQEITEDIKLKTKNQKDIVDFESWVLSYIVDIDLDFFAHETDVHSKIVLLQKLITSASVVTIATSPFFLDQKYALELIHMLLDEIDK